MGESPRSFGPGDMEEGWDISLFVAERYIPYQFTLTFLVTHCTHTYHRLKL